MIPARFVGAACLIVVAGTCVSPILARQAADVTASGSGPRQIWVHQDPQSIDYVALTSKGHLLLMTDDRVAVLDGATGAAVWSRDDIRGCSRQRNTNLVTFRHGVRCKYLNKFELGFGAVAGDPPLLLGLNPEDGQFIAIDLTSGKTLYESDGRAPGEVREYRYSESSGRVVLLIETANNRHSFVTLRSNGQLGSPFDSTITNDLVWLGARNERTLLVYGKDREDTRVISEIDVEAGRVLWQSTAILNEDIEDGPSIVGGGGRWRQKPFEFTAPVFDTDSSVVLFITKDGPLRVSSDGKLLWRFEPLKGKEPSFIASRDGVVVATNGRDVVGIDASNGRELWLHRGKSELSAIESHDRGILIWAQESVALVHPRTGASAWNQPASVPENWSAGSGLTSDFRPDYSRVQSPKLIVGDMAYVAGGGRVVSVSLQDGSARNVSTYNFRAACRSRRWRFWAMTSC